MTKKLICCLCGKKIEDKYGHNPEPLGKALNDRCYSFCNAHKVIPARLNKAGINRTTGKCQICGKDVIEELLQTRMDGETLQDISICEECILEVDKQLEKDNDKEM